MRRYFTIDYFGRAKPVCKRKHDTLLKSERRFITVYDTGDEVFITHFKNCLAAVILAVISVTNKFDYFNWCGCNFDWKLQDVINDLSRLFKQYSKNSEGR